MKQATKLTSIRLNTKLADEAVKALNVQSRSEAVHTALKEIVDREKFKNMMTKYGGKLKFKAHGK